MKAARTLRRKLVIARVPFPGQLSPQVVIVSNGAEVPVALVGPHIFHAPVLGHYSTVDQHHGGFPFRDAQHPGPLHVEVEQDAWIGQVNLIDVVINRPALAARKRRNGVTVIGEPGFPASPVDAFQVLHQIDLINACWIADLHDGPDKDSFGPKLGVFGAEEYAHGRFAVRRDTRCDVETNHLRLDVHTFCTVAVLAKPVR